MRKTYIIMKKYKMKIFNMRKLIMKKLIILLRMRNQYNRKKCSYTTKRIKMMIMGMRRSWLRVLRKKLFPMKKTNLRMRVLMMKMK